MLQPILNSFITASWVALVASGFGLVFYCGRFFHFAQGTVFMAGAYFTYFLRNFLGLSLFASVVLSIALSAGLGCLIELAVYRPLRHKGASSLAMLLASLGMYVVLQNTIAMVFGSDTKTIRQGDIQEGLNVLGAKITQLQVLTICISMTLLMVLAIALKRTKVGVAIRTLASDPELARTVGIDPDRVMFWVFFIASSLGGIAGILVALDVDMTPTMGMTAMLMGVVAVIIGGVRSPLGVLLGALLLGMAQHLGVWKVGAQWQDAIAFAILLIFLLIRPRGIFGRKLRRSEV